MKRSIDILISCIVCVTVLSWMIPLLLILIPIDTRGSVFFLQKRKGKNGRSFYCIKFRTMIPNIQADWLPAAQYDIRITRLGKILRRWHIDELPQFINVLMGHMSMVGPRPHMQADCNRFSVIVNRYNDRHQVKPGITGMAQIRGYHGPAMDPDSIYKRYCWDIWYIRNCSALLDIKILLGTFLNIFRSQKHKPVNNPAHIFEYPQNLQSFLR